MKECNLLHLKSLHKTMRMSGGRRVATETIKHQITEETISVQLVIQHQFEADSLGRKKKTEERMKSSNEHQEKFSSTYYCCAGICL